MHKGSTYMAHQNLLSRGAFCDLEDIRTMGHARSGICTHYATPVLVHSGVHAARLMLGYFEVGEKQHSVTHTYKNDDAQMQKQKLKGLAGNILNGLIIVVV